MIGSLPRNKIAKIGYSVQREKIGKAELHTIPATDGARYGSLAVVRHTSYSTS